MAQLDTNQELTLTCVVSARYARFICSDLSVTITLNGEPHELDRPLSIIDLLATLDIDPRRVAIEHNLTILKRHTFPEVFVGDGDTVEIVNFVGGG
jgi:thiamine biosynthesis protein ThiS